MDIQQKLRTMKMTANLSTLWIFVFLNVIFRDIHEFFRPGFLEEIMTGTVNGAQMTEGMLLVAGILLEIPIAMVILSRVLDYRLNRWANVIVPALTVGFIFSNGVTDLDDIFFTTVEAATLALIAWTAWRWPNPAQEAANSQQIGLERRQQGAQQR